MSQDDSILYAITGIINGPGLADTSLIGIRYARTGKAPDLDIYIPASMAGSEQYWDWPEIVFDPSSPAKLGAFGNAVTSDEYGVHLGLSVPYADYDARGQQGAGAGARSPTPKPSTVAPRSKEITPKTNVLSGNNVQYVR